MVSIVFKKIALYFFVEKVAYMEHFKHSLIQAVREMLERHWDVYEVASKLKIDVQVVQAIIDLIT